MVIMIWSCERKYLLFQLKIREFVSEADFIFFLSLLGPKIQLNTGAFEKYNLNLQFSKHMRSAIAFQKDPVNYFYVLISSNF